MAFQLFVLHCDNCHTVDPGYIRMTALMNPTAER